MTKSTTRLAVLLLLTLGLLTGAHAQITPLGDSYTNTADPTTNYGAKTLLDVDGATQITYIQFNLASIPSGASVSQATLKLYVNTVATAGSFNVDYVNGAWSESTIDSNNAPPPGNAIASNVSITTADKNQYILINVTSALQAWLNASETNNGIALVANSTFNATFDSKESTTTSHPPELDIVFAGDGTITGVTTASGSGLTGGGTSGTLNLSLTHACSTNQVLQWNGSAWVCAAAGAGTITGVTAGTDLTGGGTSGNVTLNLNTAKVPLLAANNTFTGNQTVNGNLSATGAVTGSSYQIGSNLFDYGSYANLNAFLGFAGNSTMTGEGNTATGVTALSSTTTGSYNTSIGANSLLNNTTGNYNTAIGEQAGLTVDGSDLTGTANTALGAYAYFSTGTLTNATVIGAGAEVSESNAIVLGSISGVHGSNSSTNVGIGTTAPAYSLDVHGTGNFTGAVNFGSAVTFASGQTFPGTGTLTGVTAGTGLSGGGTTGTVTVALASKACASGSALSALPFTCSPFATLAANTFAGNQTVNGNLSATGIVTGSSFNIGSNLFAFGSYANNSVFVGFAGNPANGPGADAAVGWNALANDSVGDNAAIGSQALANNTTGTFNTASGLNALTLNTTGSSNTASGDDALQLNTTGSGNTAIGSNAGFTSDVSRMTANFDTFVGANSYASTGTLTNVTAIGSYALVSENDALVLGCVRGQNNCPGAVDVGIGTTAPGATLDVHDSGYGFPATISATSSATNNAVQGNNTATSGNANGGLFITSSPQGSGIVAQNTGTGGNDYAAYLVGNVYISGNVSKGGGSFEIDHPLDPANKFLYHSFVESPDMMNVYNGNIVTNARGVATVVLPDYFEALNRDFRYQLTVIGQFAQAIVARKIGHNRFVIRTSKPNVEVSWQVTGIRHDAYADAHRIEVEVEKAPQEQGRYLHPELFGAPAGQAIGYVTPPTPGEHAIQSDTAHVSSAKTPTRSLK